MRTMRLDVLAAALTAAMAARAAAQDPSDAIYDESRIATFRLTMDPAGWNAICYDGAGAGDQWWRATMTWQGETVEGVGVKKAGESAKQNATPKPAIRLSFNEFEFANPAGPGTPGRKWRGVNRIKLDGMIGDNWDMMTDRINYWIYRSIGNHAPRACHAHLYVNGDYKGLYTVEEPVRKDMVRYNWREDGGNLYKPDGWQNHGWRWQGPDPASYVPSPFLAETNYPGGDYRDLRDVIDILNNSASAGDVRTRLAQVINLDRFFRHLAAETAMRDYDGVVAGGGGTATNNHYWYHLAADNKLQLIKWDPSASYWPGEETSPLGNGYSNNPITAWIPQDPVAWDTYKQKIRDVLNGPVAGIQAKIDAIANQIRPHVYNDPVKGILISSSWGGSDPDGFTNAEWEADVQRLKDWWTARVNFLWTQLGQAPPPPPPPPPPPAPADAAEFVAQDVPSTMAAGQAYTVNVTMRNSGTTSWTAAAGYRLNSRGPYDNTTWGVNRVPLAAGESVAPGQQKTFTFTLTAPAAAGTYLSRWSVANDAVGGFDATTPDVNVTVSGAPPPPPPPPPTGSDDAAFVAQDVPSTMAAGQAYTVNVTMRNSGTTSWTAAAGYRLNSRGPYDNTTWGVNRIPLAAGESVAPGQEKTFTFTMTAPTTPGTYLSRWSMAVGTGPFGATTPDVNVTVTAAPPPPPPTTGTKDARFVSQNIPAAMTAGQSVDVTVTMRNSGTTTWTEAGQYRLTSRGPRDNTVWGINRAYLAPGDSIAPGQTATFAFTMSAPAAPGTYLSRWSMVQDGVDVFGETTADVNVVVSAAAPTPVAPAPTPASRRMGENANGDGWINDRCGGSVTASRTGAPVFLWPAFGLLAAGFGFRRRASPRSPSAAATASP